MLPKVFQSAWRGMNSALLQPGPHLDNLNNGVSPFLHSFHSGSLTCIYLSRKPLSFGSQPVMSYWVCT